MRHRQLAGRLWRLMVVVGCNSRWMAHSLAHALRSVMIYARLMLTRRRWTLCLNYMMVPRRSPVMTGGGRRLRILCRDWRRMFWVRHARRFLPTIAPMTRRRRLAFLFVDNYGSGTKPLWPITSTRIRIRLSIAAIWVAVR